MGGQKYLNFDKNIEIDFKFIQEHIWQVMSLALKSALYCGLF